MTGTIELLETIGRDASLRHAAGEELAQALTLLQASEGLKQAACSGDSRHLAQELGPRTDPPPNHNPNNGGCGEEEEEGFDEDAPDGEDGVVDREAKPEF